MKQSGKLFLLSAPSGTGKTTLVNGLLERAQQKNLPLERVITYTSRTPRNGEVSGIDYHFVSEPDFQEKIKQNYFIEWSNVYGAFYGSPAYILPQLDTGTSLLMILDIAGAQSVMAKRQAVSIWIAPPALDVLTERLAQRACCTQETEEQRNFRLDLARKELANTIALKSYKYHLVNNELTATLDALEQVIDRELLP